jgi:hypothetical protein
MRSLRPAFRPRQSALSRKDDVFLQVNHDYSRNGEIRHASSPGHDEFYLGVIESHSQKPDEIKHSILEFEDFGPVT